MPAMRRAGVMLAIVAAAMMAAAAPASAGELRAGAGRADITPRTGYYLGGWTRADRTAHGQHTRLFARTLVLERDGRKVALVAIDLFMVPGGIVKQIGDRLAARGFSEQNIVVSASHTHSGPGGYANFPTLNTAAPSLQTATDPVSYFNFFNPQRADPQLYRFVLEQIEKSIVRADDDLGRAEAGWGSDSIVGLTRNRSVEAHLADHGIVKPRGDGTPEMDPDGPVHTIDPAVDVLRVDKIVRRGRKRIRVPIGAWSNFADHGTVTKSTFQFYNADHHASAMRVFEADVRKRARVVPGQEVVNVYGNSNEGDMSAGLDRDGPAASDFVGRVEAAAMLRAWKRAGRAMTPTPALDTRWTRMCFCGQETEGGRVDDHSQVGLPFLTGSEEERGPLFDVTHEEFEDRRAPIYDHTSPQGQKLFLEGVGTGGVPSKVPLVAVRIGPRVIVTIPGEGTKEVGARIRAAVESAIAGSGIERVVISGLANEFVLYFTTPEEYDRQHYEGGNTHFGRVSSNLVKQELATLAGHLVRGEPAQPAADFDPTNGVAPDGPEYGSGAASGTLIAAPSKDIHGRLDRAALAWQGGPEGLDRPVDRAFVTAERRAGRRWVRVDDDLGLAMLWKVDGSGRHDAEWEIPLDAPVGVYRFVVTAKRYRIESPTFKVAPGSSLKVVEVAAPAGRVAVTLEYPDAIRDVDLTARPKHAVGGAVRFRVGDRVVEVRRRRGTIFSVAAPAGVPVSVLGGGGRDTRGNYNRAPLKLR
jgi:neutral ceramidase